MIMTPRCPLCSSLPALVLDDGHQAFCGNDDCELFTWDTHKPLDELLTNSTRIDLSPRYGGDDPSRKREP